MNSASTVLAEILAGHRFEGGVGDAGDRAPQPAIKRVARDLFGHADMVAGDGAIERADHRQMLQRIDDVEQIVEARNPSPTTAAAVPAPAPAGAAGAAATGRVASMLHGLFLSKLLASEKCALLLEFHASPCSASRQNLPARMVFGAGQIALVSPRPNSQSAMPSAKRILLVDADAVLRASLAEQLAREGAYAVIEAGQRRRSARAGQGRRLCPGHHRSGPAGRRGRCPGARTESTRFRRADAASGGQGRTAARRRICIAKPFRFADLLARLNLHLSRHAASDDQPVPIGPYLFQPGAKLLTEGARKVRLTEKETDILKFLHAAGAHRGARDPAARSLGL